MKSRFLFIVSKFMVYSLHETVKGKDYNNKANVIQQSIDVKVKMPSSHLYLSLHLYKSVIWLYLVQVISLGVGTQ